MKKMIKIGQILVGFLIFAGLSYLLILTVVDVTVWLSKLQKEILAALIGAVATTFVGIAAVIITQKQSKQRDIEESHRPKKVEIYKNFLDTVSRVFANYNDKVSKKGITDQELIDYLVEYKTELLLWGSPLVIKRQLEYEKIARENGNSFLALDNLYRAIREDIGLSNKGLNTYDLMKMYLSDPDELENILIAKKVQDF